jgi:hypothetical protein
VTMRRCIRFARRSCRGTLNVDGTNSGVNNNKLQQQGNNFHKQRKHLSVKDLLCDIPVTAPVFHAEMSELKAVFARNTTQTTAGRTTSGGGR